MTRTNLKRLIAGPGVFVLVLLVFLAGFGYVMLAQPDPEPGSAPSTAPPSSSKAGQPRPAYRPMAAPAAPVRLEVPSLDIKAPVLPIQVNDERVLDPPANPRDVGWWDRSARPGDKRGQTVLTGHTVHTGGGVMDELGDLRPGQQVRVVTDQGTMHYRATKVVVYSKAELAERSVELFAQERRSTRLVLITCDDWNGEDYDSNIVVYADPLGVRAGAA